MEIELKIYFDESYYFISKAPANNTVQSYLNQLSREFSLLFNDLTTILGIQNINFVDIPPNAVIHQSLSPGEHVHVLRQIVTTLPQKLSVQILKLPSIDPETLQLSQSANPRRCAPYCSPLSKFGTSNCQCTICGEIKSYEPILGPYCTRFCYSSESRKMKSQNCDFCSICLGRLRSGKYNLNSIHQCSVCHRPWLILNRQGVCRTCHALIRQDFYNDRMSFKPDRLLVVGDGAIDPARDVAIRESREIGRRILEKYRDDERIIDKLQYSKSSINEHFPPRKE
ncbi:hypothetical protein SS50377_24733 [Spironucleus salmonicida]|uniref:Uncharacterized protein n=1 Tax=Spironucleus salmonicida TaxID=348837 RepID=V6LUY3_9EUKA|nr:hypothetical protein SS50377_24733 [Spironucleus salmonicida]|eukprot:EST44614.1 hypothetical protein SS50377_15619 [Spironucleus salmonicida]